MRFNRSAKACWCPKGHVSWHLGACGTCGRTEGQLIAGSKVTPEAVRFSPIIPGTLIGGCSEAGEAVNNAACRWSVNPGIHSTVARRPAVVTIQLFERRKYELVSLIY